MANISLQHLDKIYDNNVQAVFDFNLEVKDGEFIVLVGPSGCGKSTTLRMIAGLEDISAGKLLLDGVDITAAPAKDRDMAMVFQNYALYGHMLRRASLTFLGIGPVLPRRIGIDDRVFLQPIPPSLMSIEDGLGECSGLKQREAQDDRVRCHREQCGVDVCCDDHVVDENGIDAHANHDQEALKCQSE